MFETIILRKKSYSEFQVLTLKVSHLSVYVGFSPVDSATVFKVSLTLIVHEPVVSGHLIGRTSPGGLMNMNHEYL